MIGDWSSGVLDDAITQAAARRRRRVVGWLSHHPTTRVALRMTRATWRRRGVPLRAARATARGINWATDRTADHAARRWAHYRTRSTGGGWSAPAGHVRCGACGRLVPGGNIAAHLAWHARWDTPATASSAAGRGRARRRIAAITAAPSSSSRGFGPGPVEPLTRPTSRGARMTTGTPETSTLLRAATAVAGMEPETAWDLDAQLVGLARGVVAISDAIGDYAETLDLIRLDPRVTGPVLSVMELLTGAGGQLAQVAAIFRTLYAAQIEAAEGNVRQPKPGFFDPN